MAVSPLFLHYVGKVFRPLLHLDIGAEWSADLAGMARVKKTHCIVVTLETYGRDIEAAVAQSALGLRALAARLAYRADIEARAALAAEFAGLIEGPSDTAIQAAPRKTDRARHHLLLAHAHAKPALDAGFILALVAALAYPHGRSHVLDPLGLRTDRDVHLKQQSPRLLYSRGMRPNFHAILCGQAARGLESLSRFAIGANAGGDFHQAQPACAIGREPVVVTKRGDRYSQEPRRIQHGAALFRFYLYAVNFQRWHGTLLYSTSTALGWQTSIQAPHLMHLAESISWTLSLSPRIASEAHTRTQAWQPSQIISSIS